MSHVNGPQVDQANSLSAAYYLSTHDSQILTWPEKQFNRAAGCRRVAGAIHCFNGEIIIAESGTVDEVKIYAGRYGKRAQHTVYIYLVLDLILRICLITCLGPAQP